MDIRLSCGSEVQLGLRKMKVCAPTNTIYMMTRGICQASCLFCTQACATYNNSLSRITWSVWEFEDILERLQNQKRVCIQCLNYPEIFEDLLEIVRKIHCPVSVSAQPFTIDEMRELSGHVDRISISLDCFTPQLFETYKPFYNWDLHWARIRKAVDIFGKGKVISHLIVGLGEQEEEAVGTLDELIGMGVQPSLFAFTPVKGTKLEKRPPPSLDTYRRLQIARHLLANGTVTVDDFTFECGKIASFGVDLTETVTSDAFQTQGCPDCNRPFFNEIPGKEPFNYPQKIPAKHMGVLLEQAGVKQ